MSSSKLLPSKYFDKLEVNHLKANDVKLYNEIGGTLDIESSNKSNNLPVYFIKHNCTEAYLEVTFITSVNSDSEEQVTKNLKQQCKNGTLKSSYCEYIEKYRIYPIIDNQKIMGFYYKENEDDS